MEEKIRKELCRMLRDDNYGLPDEIEWEVDRIMYGKNMYEQAKWKVMTEE